MSKIKLCTIGLCLANLVVTACFPGEFIRDYNAGTRYYSDGVEHFNNGKYHDAFEDFDMAVFELKWALREYYFGAHSGISETQAEAARRMAAQATMFLGVIYSYSSQHKEAIKEFSEALEYDGLSIHQRSAILSMRGTSFYLIGDRKNAVIDYNKAVNIDPNNEQVRTLGVRLGF